MPKGLWATPEYIREHGERTARFMTRMMDGMSLEEAQGKEILNVEMPQVESEYTNDDRMDEEERETHRQEQAYEISREHSFGYF